jgi:hypothetical protein
MTRLVFRVCTLIGLGVCVLLPVLFFLGRIEERAFKNLYLVVSAAYFVFASRWSSGDRKPGAEG